MSGFRVIPTTVSERENAGEEVFAKPVVAEMDTAVEKVPDVTIVQGKLELRHLPSTPV